MLSEAACLAVDRLVQYHAEQRKAHIESIRSEARREALEAYRKCIDRYIESEEMSDAEQEQLRKGFPRC